MAEIGKKVNDNTIKIVDFLKDHKDEYFTGAMLKEKLDIKSCNDVSKVLSSLLAIGFISENEDGLLKWAGIGTGYNPRLARFFDVANVCSPEQ